MDANNPYGSPNAPVLARPPQLSPSGAVSTLVIDQLAGTRPWVRLLSVLTFVASGFMLVGAFGMFFMGGMATVFATPGNKGAASGAMMGGACLFYLVLVGLYIFPGIKLWKYANRISAVMSTRSEIDLEQALREQRVFWKFAAVSIIALFVLFIVAALLSSIFAVGTGSGIR